MAERWVPTDDRLGVETQELIFKYIEGYIKRRGFAPTYREIVDNCGLSSTSVVTYHVKQLTKQGRLYSKGEGRGIGGLGKAPQVH